MTLTLLFAVFIFFVVGSVSAFSFAFVGATAVAPTKNARDAPSPMALEVKDVTSRVAVAGATGRLGRLVVEDLLERGVDHVVAIVRDTNKAKDLFPNAPPNLEIVKCDLGNENDIASVLEGVDAAIWCATGFSDSPGASILLKLQRLLGVALAPRKSIDAVALPAMAKYLSKQNAKQGLPPLPKIVMCSSAGVTRPMWDQEKKERFAGAADIPIVRLNPFGILNVKRESEEKLRQSGVEYCIVRPTGLNDKWPPNSRPLFSQGDVAVGRINRKDVASVLIDVLSAPEAVGKTFEVLALAGYPKAVSIRPALSRLVPDSDQSPSLESLTATYTALQQLLPGEQQDAAALAMGQTYEQLDRGEQGRLGKRGQENAEAAAPEPSS